MDFNKKNDFFTAKSGIKSIPVYEPPASNCEVSFLIPLYKRYKMAMIALDSCLKQDYGNFQIIIVDDCFEEKNELLAYIVKNHFPNVIYYRNEENLGLYANWNRCFSLSNTIYSVMVHTDNVLSSNYLNVMYRLKEKVPNWAMLCPNKNDLEISSLDYLAKISTIEEHCSRVVLQKLDFFSFNFAMHGYIQGSFIKTQAIIDSGGFEPDSFAVEDYPFIASFSEKHSIYFCDLPLFTDILFENFGRNTEMWEKQMERIFDVYKSISNRSFFAFRPFLNEYAIYKLSSDIDNYNRGTSWIKTPCSIDKRRVFEKCGIKKSPTKPANAFKIWVVEHVIFRLRNFKRKISHYTLEVSL